MDYAAYQFSAYPLELRAQSLAIFWHRTGPVRGGAERVRQQCRLGVRSAGKPDQGTARTEPWKPGDERFVVRSRDEDRLPESSRVHARAAGAEQYVDCR